MAVVVDEPFWTSLGTITEVLYVSNCDIVWFVVRYVRSNADSQQGSARYQIVLKSIHKCTLDRAVEGLTGGSPVSLEEFEGALKKRLEQTPADQDLSNLDEMALEDEEPI